MQNEYGSENGEDGDSLQEMDEGDQEGDREVEELKRRLERVDYMQIKRKMKPNISLEWIVKLKEYLRRAGC
jgi:uncharacterized coiled-coil DUF342 family protein